MEELPNWPFRTHTIFWDVQERGKPFSGNDFFKKYHRFEQVGVNDYRKYTKQVRADYGHGEKLYNMVPYGAVIIDNGARRQEYWIVASESISAEEFKLLTPYCCCPMCRGKYPWYVCMGVCEGCFMWEMKDDLLQDTIDQARALRQSLNGKSPTLWRTCICLFLFYGFVALFLVLFLYTLFGQKK